MSCNCEHEIVCRHRTDIIEAAIRVIDIRFGGQITPTIYEWLRVNCKYYKPKEKQLCDTINQQAADLNLINRKFDNIPPMHPRVFERGGK